MLRKTRHLKTMAICSALVDLGRSNCTDHIVTRTDADGNLLTGANDVCAVGAEPIFYYDKTYAGGNIAHFKVNYHGYIKI